MNKTNKVTENSSDEFTKITKVMHAIYVKKNHDYGNSFDTSLDKHGLIASIVRMEDKMNRINSLSKKGTLIQALVTDESIKDTLLDLANYSIMTIMWLNKSNNKNDK